MKLEISEGDHDVAYLRLVDESPRDRIAKQVRLSDLVEYKGPDLYFDFDQGGNLVGVEIFR